MCFHSARSSVPLARSFWTVLFLLIATAISVFGFSVKATSAFGLDGLAGRISSLKKISGLSREQPPARPEQIWDNPLLRPAFDNTTSNNVITATGRVSYLHCRVNHLGNRVVTWLRKRDGHVLTVGLYAYTTDQRFTALHSEGSPDWVLKITSPQTRDSGVYECQVSTEPKISRAFNFTVVESFAVIEGQSSIYMSAGNTLNLTCQASIPGDAPNYFYWYHNGEVVQYSGKEVTEASSTSSGPSGRSKLVIKNVHDKHSGNYTCAPENAAPATVSVYVLKGEHPAAMQHGESSTAVPRASFLALLALCSAFIFFGR
ncbi:limbic system-associated membrane protein-like isoform X1 [Macrobrachium rosenbergii]|uniref:limbic system-associated membrane protein-like isoform X1 n=1 Tax=Macrobrachium rosenbergii TaxID=79674 RepID=UPI0034D73AF1